MLILKSYHNAGPKERLVWGAVRRMLPRRARMFYEGCTTIPGQLWYQERKALYQAIRKYRPKTVFEVGTWYGGGSTFFIAQALHDNGSGLLYTVEPNENAFGRALAGYKQQLPELFPHVRFMCGNSTDVFPAVLNGVDKVDALFLDGAQDRKQTADEFAMFESYLDVGSIFMGHDWDNDKMELVRSSMEQAAAWRLKTRLSAPHSLGFAVYEKIAHDQTSP